MNRLLRGIQSHTTELCVLDTLLSFSNIPFLFYYANEANDPKFMPAELLRDSFTMALLDFPVLVGHLEMDGRGHAKIVVDAGSLNAPEYIESQSNVHFRDLQASRFSWNALPDGVATAGPVTTADSAGEMKLANIHVVRLRDNSGIVLFVNASHAVFDGVGYCAFVTRWADICKSMHAGHAPSRLVAFQGNFARSTLTRHTPNDRKALDDCTRDMFTTSGLLARWLAWISPKTRGTLISNAVSLPHNVGHLFHISADKLASLRGSLREHTGGIQYISDNDIITALVSMLVAQSEAELGSWTLDLSSMGSLVSSLASALLISKKEFATEIVVDTRPRLAGLSTKNYIGNAVFATCLTNPLSVMTGGIGARSLAQVAVRIRQLVSSIDAQYIGQLLDTLNGNPSRFMCPLARDTTRMPAVVSNQSRFALYKADFGNGIPTWVSPIKVMFPHYVSIIPVHPSTSGYGIHITMSKQAMANILRNKFWMNAVELLY
ncbi:hypothetical protein GGI20_005589 [Coemansia sp. BCRC 34301]|nr:hypothetical protein GGI20_005589 [Coemansia sp. BCRC 34301]